MVCCVVVVVVVVLCGVVVVVSVSIIETYGLRLYIMVGCQS